MGRRARTRADVQDKFQEAVTTPRRQRRSPHEGRAGLDFRELVAAVCRYFCKGHSAPEIRALIKAEFKVEMNREEPYQFIQYAASKGWIRYVAPHEADLRERIREKYLWLKGVEVVHTASYEQVAFRGAQVLRDLICQCRKDECHVGWAGGHSMRQLACELAELFRKPTDELPKSVVFHAMVAGLDVLEPTKAPNAFFSYFVQDPAPLVRTRFVGLSAPPMVFKRQIEEIKGLPAIAPVYEAVANLDVIVTSATCWADAHPTLLNYISQSTATLEKLLQAGCVGDMMWRPLGRRGPIENEGPEDIRAMTLMELSDLPGFIRDQGKNVLLVLGPCGLCHTPKTEILDTILDQKGQLITHVVTDTRTARGLFQKSAA